ncbi:MAG: LAGLIDADG family homing endonuclease, partial [Candidatus Liptonbacteria bacterium]
KYLYESLISKEGLRRKSKNMTFPAVPDQYLPDFTRGYFDGDGSVFRVRYLSTKNHKPRVELRSNFTSGSRPFLETLMSMLNKKLGLTLKKIGVYNNGLSLKLGYATGDTEKLMNFMYYPGFKIGLQRKAVYVKHIRA